VNPALVIDNATDDDPWAEGHLAAHMDGTGPFKFVSWEPKQFVAVDRNEEYWKGPAKLANIVFRLVEEPATTRLMLEKGEVDVVHNLPTDMIDALKQNSDVVIGEKPGLETMYWAFNSQMEPFNDPLVRQALSYAVDYNAIMDNLVKDGGIRMRGPLPKGLASFDETVMLFERDIEKAKSLLDEAGYPNGFTVTTHYPVWRNIADIAVVLQANFADVGVQLDLEEVPLGGLVEHVVNGTSPFFPWVSTPTYADPDAALYPKFHTTAIPFGAAGNVGRYSDPDVDTLLDEARTSSDNARRLELYGKVQHIVVGDAAWVFLTQNVTQQPLRSWVKGYEIPVIGNPDFWSVDIVK
jgi:peptide/nickel transport system substrate-binding protein